MLCFDYKNLFLIAFLLTSINGCFHDSLYGGDYYELAPAKLDYIKINDVDVSTNLSVKQAGLSADQTNLIADEAVFAGDNILPDIRVGYSSEDEYLSVELDIYSPQNNSKLTVMIYSSFFDVSNGNMSANVSYIHHSQVVAFMEAVYLKDTDGNLSNTFLSVNDDEFIIHTNILLTEFLSPLIEKYVLDQASRPLQSADEVVTVTELKSFFSNGGVYVFNLNLGYTLSFKNISARRGMGCFFLAGSESEKPVDADDLCREEIAYVSSDTVYSGTFQNVELDAFSINEVELVSTTEEYVQNDGPEYLGDNLQPEIIIQLKELDNNDFQYLNLDFSFTDNTNNSVLEIRFEDILLNANTLKFSSHSKISASYAHRDIDDLSIYQAEKKVSIKIQKEATSILEINGSGLSIHSNFLLEALSAQAATNSLNYSMITPVVPEQFDDLSSHTYHLGVSSRYGDFLTIGRCVYFSATEGDIPESADADCPLR